MPARTPIEERLPRLSRINEQTGCREWIGCKTKDGYGRVIVEGVVKWAHRVAYELYVGPIPDGLQIDHLCRNRSCINPDHLEVVTFEENMRRSAPAQKTHCVHGHEFNEENTYFRNRGLQRDCRACGRERTAAYLKRKAA